MALSRNERRKLSKLRALERAKRVQRAVDNAAHVERMAIIQRNLRNGVERNYLPNASCISGFAGKLHAAREYRNASGVTVDRKESGPRLTVERIDYARNKAFTCEPGKKK
jgi:hypothetical protein